MKHVGGIFILLCLLSSLTAMQVPLSDVPVFTPENMLQGFFRVSPEDAAAEKLHTKVWLWQDNEVLNVHFACEIDSSFFPGQICTRDNGSDADYVRVQLITIPDAYYAYYYLAYPTGNLSDAVRDSDLSIDYNYNSAYSYSTSHNDKLWEVTLKIPLNELRFKQQLPYNWKIILTRYHKETQENYSLPFVLTKMKKDYYAKAQDIVLNHPVKRNLDISLRPYFVKSYDLVNKTDSFDPDNVGADFSFNPGQRTRIKLSMNPDFTDVPPDDAADNYNNKYPPYYGENRFFFTEDIDAFGIDEDYFYTRNIVQPRFAYKATGNTKRFNWGVLGAFDKEIRYEGKLINRDDYFQALSFIPSWKNLKLGSAIISRTNDGYYNHVYSGNYSLDIGETFNLSSRILGSIRKTEAEEETNQKEGYLANISLNASPGDWDHSLYYTQTSQDFYADAGYQYERDFHMAGASSGWSVNDPTKFVTMKYASVWAEYYDYFHEGDDQYSAGAFYSLKFINKLGFNFNGSWGATNDLLGHSKDYYSVGGSGYYNKWEKLSFNTGYSHAHVMVYSLFDTFDRDRGSLSLWGNFNQAFSYDLAADFISYMYPKYSIVTIDSHNFPIKLDNRYAIVNAELSYTPSQKTSFTGGMGMSTYETISNYGTMNLFGNLRYEFRPDCFLYMGFNTNQIQDEKSLYEDPLGHYQRNSANAYVKVGLKI